MLNRHGRVLIGLVLLIVVVLAIWLLPGYCGGSAVTSEPFEWKGRELVNGDHVADYILRFLKRPCKGRKACEEVVLNQKRARRAPGLGALIDNTADARGFDPLILAVVADAESSFYERPKLLGKKGEQGLCQVHGLALTEALKRGYDMRTSEGQLAAGADHLLRSFEQCNGTLLQTLSRYQTGSCRSKAGGPKWRTRKIRRERARIMKQLVALIARPFI